MLINFVNNLQKNREKLIKNILTIFHKILTFFVKIVRGSYSLLVYFYQKNVFFIFYLMSASSTNYFKNFNKHCNYLSFAK